MHILRLVHPLMALGITSFLVVFRDSGARDLAVRQEFVGQRWQEVGVDAKTKTTRYTDM